jgi:hypothetical protein
MDAISDDLLYGAGPIAEFLYGDVKHRRKVYHNAAALPVFRMGAILCARRSQLVGWIAEQETAARQGKFIKKTA